MSWNSGRRAPSRARAPSRLGTSRQERARPGSAARSCALFAPNGTALVLVASHCRTPAPPPATVAGSRKQLASGQGRTGQRAPGGLARVFNGAGRPFQDWPACGCLPVRADASGAHTGAPNFSSIDECARRCWRALGGPQSAKEATLLISLPFFLLCARLPAPLERRR